jgi:hypothetical protein
VRGHRLIMLDDTDINEQGHIRGAVIASQNRSGA